MSRIITDNSKVNENLLKEIASLKHKLNDFERFDFLVHAEIGTKRYTEIKEIITDNPSNTLNK